MRAVRTFFLHIYRAFIDLRLQSFLSYKIATVFILAVLNVFSVEGQVVPEWFLHPKEREYTGVSYPSKYSNARKANALMSALLRYKASLVKERKTVTTFTAYSHPVEEYNELNRFIGKEAVVSGYKIVKEYINENGELFWR